MAIKTKSKNVGLHYYSSLYPCFSKFFELLFLWNSAAPAVEGDTVPVITDSASAFASASLPQTKPYNTSAGHYKEDELSFIVTIQETVFLRPKEHLVTPNFFEILEQKICLPTDSTCFECLTNRTCSNCERCREACPCKAQVRFQAADYHPTESYSQSRPAHSSNRASDVLRKGDGQIPPTQSIDPDLPLSHRKLLAIPTGSFLE
jgi:hypothetical protein